MIEETKDFHKRHGGDNQSVVEYSYRYYSDGARLEMRFDARHEPPTDQVELQRAIVTYYKIRLGQAERTFRELEQRLKEYTNAGLKGQDPLPVPSDEEFEKLERLQKTVLDLRPLYERERTALVKIDPREKVLRERERSQSRQIKEFEDAKLRLNKIRI